MTWDSVGASAQRSVTAFSRIASSGTGQSSAWMRTGRSGSRPSSSCDAADAGLRAGADSLPSMVGPRLRFEGAGAESPPPPALPPPLRLASLNASFTSLVAIPFDSWIAGSISIARAKLWIALSRFLSPMYTAPR